MFPGDTVKQKLLYEQSQIKVYYQSRLNKLELFFNTWWVHKKSKKLEKAWNSKTMVHFWSTKYSRSFPAHKVLKLYGGRVGDRYVDSELAVKWFLVSRYAERPFGFRKVLGSNPVPSGLGSFPEYSWIDKEDTIL